MASGIQVTSFFDAKKLMRQLKADETRFLFRAGRFAQQTASRSIRKVKRPSLAGQPPHSGTGQLRKSIRFAVDRADSSVVIGPTRESIGLIGSVHEFGGRFRGRRYPKRPFMQPALEKTQPQLPRLWAQSIRS